MEDPINMQQGSVPNDPDSPLSHEPTPEEIERTKQVMRDSLAARKPKGFLESLKEWFR
jgi:hypothetical protein